MKEYKIRKPMKIIFSISMFFILAFCVYLILIPFSHDYNLAGIIFIVCLDVLMMTIIIMGGLSFLKRKIIIDSNSISEKGLFFTKKLDFNQIKAYMINQQYIILIPNEKELPKIKLNMMLENFEELLKEIDIENIENISFQ